MEMTVSLIINYEIYDIGRGKSLLSKTTYMGYLITLNLLINPNGKSKSKSIIAKTATGIQFVFLLDLWSPTKPDIHVKDN